MTHASLVNTPDLGPHHGPKSNCHCQVAYAGVADHGGVEWVVYHCPWCSKLIYTVGGGRHWLNYEEGVSDEC
jgi:hypothetical protein